MAKNSKKATVNFTGRADILAQWVVKELLAHLISHLVVAAEGGAWVLLIGVVAGEEQTQQRANLVTFFIFRKEDGARNGTFYNVVTEFVQSDCTAIGCWEPGGDDFTAAKPLGG